MPDASATSLLAPRKRQACNFLHRSITAEKPADVMCLSGWSWLALLRWGEGSRRQRQGAAGNWQTGVHLWCGVRPAASSCCLASVSGVTS